VAGQWVCAEPLVRTGDTVMPRQRPMDAAASCLGSRCGPSAEEVVWPQKVCANKRAS
jgi:hypothetical protein